MQTFTQISGIAHCNPYWRRLMSGPLGLHGDDIRVRLSLLITEDLVIADTRSKVLPTVPVTHPRGKSILIYFFLFVNTLPYWSLESEKRVFSVSISYKDGVDFVYKNDAMSY
jgi:hypothetical protein